MLSAYKGICTDIDHVRKNHILTVRPRPHVELSRDERVKVMNTSTSGSVKFV